MRSGRRKPMAGREDLMAWSTLALWQTKSAWGNSTVRGQSIVVQDGQTSQRTFETKQFAKNYAAG
jgi:hypothetical protein